MAEPRPSTSLTIPSEYITRNLGGLFTQQQHNQNQMNGGIYAAGNDASAVLGGGGSSYPFHLDNRDRPKHSQHLPITMAPASTQFVPQVQQTASEFLQQINQHVPAGYIQGDRNRAQIASLLAASIPPMQQPSHNPQIVPKRSDRGPPASEMTPSGGLKNAPPVHSYYRSKMPCIAAGIFEHNVDVGQCTILGAAPFCQETPYLFQSIDLDETDVTDMDPIWLEFIQIVTRTRDIHDGRKFLRHPRRGVMLIPLAPKDAYGRSMQVGNIPGSKLRKLDATNPTEAAEIANYRKLTLQISPFPKFFAGMSSLDTTATTTANVPPVPPAVPPPIILQRQALQQQQQQFQQQQQQQQQFQIQQQPYYGQQQQLQLQHPQQHVQSVNNQTFTPAVVQQQVPLQMAPSMTSSGQSPPSIEDEDDDDDDDDESDDDDDSEDDENDIDEAIVLSSKPKPKANPRVVGEDFGLSFMGSSLGDEFQMSTMAMIKENAIAMKKAKFAEYQNLYNLTCTLTDSINRKSLEEVRAMSVSEIQDLIDALNDDWKFETNVWHNVKDICGAWVPHGVSSFNTYIAKSFLNLQSEDGSSGDAGANSASDYMKVMAYQTRMMKHVVRKQWQDNGKKFDWFYTPLQAGFQTIRHTLNHHLNRTYGLDMETDGYSSAATKFMSSVAECVSPEEQKCLEVPASITSSQRYRDIPTTNPPSSSTAAAAATSSSSAHYYSATTTSATSSHNGTAQPSHHHQQQQEQNITHAPVVSSSSTYIDHVQATTPNGIVNASSSMAAARHTASVSTTSTTSTTPSKTISNVTDPNVRRRLDKF